MIISVAWLLILSNIIYISNADSKRLLLTAGAQITYFNGKCLTVENYEGPNVVIDDCTELISVAQRWYYNSVTQAIRNVNGGIEKCLDVKNFDGPNVQIHDCTGTNAQKWQYYPENNKIMNAKGQCLDVKNFDGPNVQIWRCTAASAQVWASTLFSDSTPLPLTIHNVGDEIDKCLDVKNVVGPNVQIWRCTESDAQKWYFIPSTLAIQNINGQCLDIKNFVGPNVQIHDCTGVTAQRWYLNTNTNEIVNAVSRKCLDIEGTNVQIYECTGESDQRWTKVEI